MHRLAFAYRLRERRRTGGCALPALRTKGFWNVAEDPRDLLGLHVASSRALLLRLLLPCLLVLCGAAPALAQGCAQPVGSVQSLEGEVSVQDAGDAGWRPAQLGQELCRESSIRTGGLSRAAVVLVNDEVLRLDQETTLKLADVPLDAEQPTLLDLAFGAVQSFSRSPKKVNVNTAFMTLAIRGTEFAVQADGDESRLTVLEGEVVASNAQGEVPVPAGSAAVARAGQAPQVALVARPRDAVQWSLYYPPIFSAPPGDAPELLEAQRLAAANDIAGALAALDRAPATPGVQAYRAALLLQVGRVDEARTALDAALAADPQDAQALALRSVIGVVQNERDAALADAQKAVELAPTSAAAKIALSYAQQARFDLDGARATMLQAVEEQPEDALAWARLSELWLMAGYRDRSREAADRAAALAPELDRVQTVRGFADLVEFRTRSASEAFERAIALNSADPLPRFGLGLAQIRDGHLEQGRQTIELAVGLDSSNSLLRTYLGKAYFEERRPAPAGDQYQVAKELDPLDPTAYLYDAIRLQSINRPVEALESLDRSIELNDNRAIYRSRLLLDSDRAARGASLARVYQDLGFRDLGVREATDIADYRSEQHRCTPLPVRRADRCPAGGESPGSASCCRRSCCRTSTSTRYSRRSARLGSTSAAVPARFTPGFNEYTALFERNMFQLNGTGLIGNNDTKGVEGVASAIYGRHSVSAGAFYYDTDGWRDNADIRHDIQSFFYQGAWTPELSVQAEARRRDSHTGDLDFNFDPDDFSRNEDRDLTQDTLRFGARYSPTPSSDFLLSLIYTHTDDKLQEIEPSPIGDTVFSGRARDDGYQGEAQYIFREELLNVIAGGGYSYVNADQRVFGSFADEIFVDTEPLADSYFPSAYVYSNINLPEPVTWTAGLSANYFEQGPVEETRVNPKLGVQYQVNDRLRLRAAAFQVVKPPLRTSQTIEPTQVAGFNQLYDDDNGATSRRIRGWVGLEDH